MTLEKDVVIQPRSERWLSPVAVTFGLRGLVGLGVAVAVTGGLGSALDGANSLLLAYLFADAIPVLFLSVSLDRRCLMVSGMANVSIGVLLSFSAGLSASTLATLAGFWAMLTGLLGLLGAGALRRRSPERALFAAAGVLAVLLGTTLGIFPQTSLSGLRALLGTFAALSGLCYFAVAYRLRHSGDPRRAFGVRRTA